MDIKFLTASAALFSFIAAVFWLCACFVSVKPNPESNDFTITINKNAKKIDFLKTAMRQTKWNTLAAGAAAIAAFLQTLSLIFSNSN